MSEVEKEFAVHEAVCAERYAAIEKAFTEGDKRMTRIEYLLYIVIARVLEEVVAIFLQQTHTVTTPTTSQASRKEEREIRCG